MAQIRYILPCQPWGAFADKFHIAVDVLEDKIEFFGIVDMAVAACTLVSTIIVEIGIVQGVPEAFCFRARALIHWDRSR
jgi:hypothetical protein